MSVSIAPAAPRLLPPPAGPVPPRESSGDPLEYISATRINTWQQCRLKFYFRYVARLEKPATPALHIGRTVHASLRLWNLARWRGDEIDPRELWPRFCQDWDEDQLGQDIDWGDRETEREKKEHAWRMLLRYFDETPIPPDERPEGVEVRVERDLSDRGLPPLVGIIDLVRGGGLIVDFKTAASTPQPDQAAHANETQLCCYALLYREATGGAESGFELHHLVKTKEPKIVITSLDPMSEKQEARIFRILDSYVSGVSAGDHVPSPGIHCSFCQFFGECRRWH